MASNTPTSSSGPVLKGNGRRRPGLTLGRTRQPEQLAPQTDRNVDANERAVSVAAGAIAALLGASRRDAAGLLIAAVGGGLVYRGVTGRCPVYRQLGVDTANRGRLAGRQRPYGIHVAQSFLIDKSPEALYAFWRNFENLPRIMTHLKSVRVLDDRRSHWVADAPRIAGGEVEWDAEMTADEPNRRIAWRSLPGSTVDHSGSIEFIRAPKDRGTAVHVTMDYVPPAGVVGHWVAKLFGEDAEQQIREDLRRFKRILELGEAPTINGQPRGTCLGRGAHDRNEP